MLDSITWGNPTIRGKELIEQKSIFDKHIPKLLDFSFPKNSSKATREELNLLVDYTNTLNGSEDYKKRYQVYDQSLEKTFAQVILDQNLGDRGVSLIDNLIDESLPFVAKLKYHFQRPRPFQLANYYKLKLFPHISFSGYSPSFPSGHTFQASLICYVLGNNFPEKYDYFEKLAKDIELSRLYLGVHYPSDNDFSLYCVEVITKDKEFREKFSI
jgi:hypothetical protein